MSLLNCKLSASQALLPKLSHRSKETLLVFAYTVVLFAFFYIEAFGLDEVQRVLNHRYPGHFVVSRSTLAQPLSASSKH